jgi:hypothetical protein
MQFKIPQNVQREDTIIGPLTMHQLIICAIGFGIAYLIYISLAKAYYFEIWGPPVVLVSLTTLAFAFVRIKGLSFFKFLLLMTEAAMIPHKRVWDKRYSTKHLFATVIAAKPKKMTKKEEQVAQTKEQKMESLDQLTQRLNWSNLMDDDLHHTELAQASDLHLAGKAIQK